MTYFVFFSRGGGGKLGKLNGKDMMLNLLFIDPMANRNRLLKSFDSHKCAKSDHQLHYYSIHVASTNV